MRSPHQTSPIARRPAAAAGTRTSQLAPHRGRRRGQRGASLAGAFLILTLLGAGAWLFLQRKAADGVTVRGVDGVQQQVGAGQAADFARRQNCLMACQSDDRYCRSMAMEPPALEACVSQDAECQAACGAVTP